MREVFENVLVGIHLVSRIIRVVRCSSESNGTRGNFRLLVRQRMLRCVRVFDLGYRDVAVKKARDGNFRLIFSLKHLDSGASISTIIIDLCLHHSGSISWLYVVLEGGLAYQVVGCSR